MDKTKYIRTESAEGEITFTPIKQRQVKSWEELGVPDTWRHMVQLEAVEAMRKLSQLMDRANDGWVPDWVSDSQAKHCIWMYLDKPETGKMVNAREFLSFRTKEIRDEFLELHRDLITQAIPLL